MKEKLKDNIIDNPDQYAEDMIIVDKNCRFRFLEIQACAEWIGEKYPHEMPFVYERKGHFDINTLFILFDKHMTQGFMFAREALNKEPVRIKKYSRFFIYQVPWSKVVSFHTCNLSMDDIYLFQI